MSQFEYTEREQMIVDLYTQKIEALEERIKDLELIVSFNEDLDKRKLSRVYRTTKGIKTFEFNKTMPIKINNQS